MPTNHIHNIESARRGLPIVVRFGHILWLALICMLVSTTASKAANTAPTFSAGSGKVFTDFGSSLDSATSLTIQTDGKILVVGSRLQTFNVYVGTQSDFALARYNYDGSLDSSFGMSGKVTTDFSFSNDWAYSVLQQPDGKILVGGSSDSGSAMARYNENGSLDLSFGLDGKQIKPNADGGLITIQSDGKILMAGSVSNNVTLSRYLSDGSQDSGFAMGGTAISSFDSSDAYLTRNVTGLLVQSDGKIVVEAFRYSSWDGAKTSVSLTRFDLDGSIDTTFGLGGMITTYGSPSGLAIDTDGKLLVTGSISEFGSNRVLLLMRYESNGTLDASFGKNGIVSTAIASSTSGGSVVVQPDGKILVAGTTYDGYNEDFAVVRYNSNGTLDTSFDADGIVTTGFGFYDSGMCIALQSDGKILVSGMSRNYDGSYGDFVLVRYNSDGSLDKAFSPEAPFGKGVGYTEDFGSVLLDENIQIRDAELDMSGNYDGTTLTLSRHGLSNPEDVFSASGTLSRLTEGAYFSVKGVTIGRVITNSGGTLTLSFNANATQTLVNYAMQHIAYANISNTPSATVQIDWTFSDGNTGAQGTGGAMSVTGSTTVTITPTNDAPVLLNPLADQRATANAVFSYTIPSNTASDPDGDVLTYSIAMADGTGVPPWLSFDAGTRTFSGTPTDLDVGSLELRVYATDVAGVGSSLFVFRLSVTRKASQTIGTIGFAPATLAVGGTTTASATASSGLAVTFSSLTPEVCSVVGSTFTGVTIGVCTIAADQAGNANYNPAPRAMQSFSVQPPASSLLSVALRGTGIGAVTSNPSGITCGADCRESYAPGTSVTLAASTPFTGSAFGWWGGACSGLRTCTVAMSSARDVTAVFVYTGSDYSFDYVQKAFVAYYGRPADPTGQAYWAGRIDAERQSLNALINEFGNSIEFTRRYGGLYAIDLVTKIYQQALNRDPDQSGLVWYVNELSAGRRTLQTITLDVLNGAVTAPDSTTVANKLDVANYFTGKVAAGCDYGGEENGVAILATVTSHFESVSAAMAAIDSRCGP